MMSERAKPAFTLNFRPVVVIFLSLIFGVVSARKLYGGDVFYIVLVSVSLVAVTVYGLVKKRYLFLCLAVIFFFGGNAGFFISYNAYLGENYSNAFVVGRVNDQLQENDGYYNLILENASANGDSIGNVSLYVWSPQEEIRVGDVLTFSADLEGVKLFTLNSFNTWAFRRGVAYSASVEGSQIELVSGGMKFDESARAAIKELIYANMQDESASVAYALVTGDQALVSTDVNEAYRGSGLIHILSVSGLHITFLAGMIAWVMKLLKVNRYVNFGITFCLLLIYSYICDFLPPVIRSVIMGLILIAAGLFGRSYDGLSALSIAGILSLLISPLYAFDLGFLMSYACVAAIYILQPPFSKVLRKVFPDKIADLFALSFATQIGVLPFMASFFSSLNLLSFFSNLVVVPIFAVLFPALIVMVLVGLIIPPLGVLLVSVDWGLRIVLIIADFFASTDLQISLNFLDPIAITLIYAVCLVGSYYFMASTRVKYAATMLLAMFFGFFTLISPSFYPRGSQISIIETYGTYNAVIESSSGQTLCLGEPAFRETDYYASSGIDGFDYALCCYNKLGGTKLLPAGSGTEGAFTYSTDGEIFIVEFDGLKILFTNDSSISYNDREKLSSYLSQQRFDFVFIDGYDFSSSKTFVAAGEGQNADYLPSEIGNFTYSFDKNVAWGID